MSRSVYITTPIPTLDEVGKGLKMSKARQQRLIEIVRGSGNGLDGRVRKGNGATPRSMPPTFRHPAS